MRMSWKVCVSIRHRHTLRHLQTHTQTRIQIHTQTRTDTNTHTDTRHTQTHRHTQLHTQTHEHKRTHTLRQYTDTHSDTHTATHRHMSTEKHAHTHSDTIHRHTQTHTHARRDAHRHVLSAEAPFQTSSRCLLTTENTQMRKLRTQTTNQRRKAHRGWRKDKPGAKVCASIRGCLSVKCARCVDSTAPEHSPCLQSASRGPGQNRSPARTCPLAPGPASLRCDAPRPLKEATP